MNVVIANRQRTRKINSPQLRRIVGDLIIELKVKDAQLGINLVAAPKMTSLNETFLQHEGSTDVITFDYSDGQKRGVLHGEIFVCVEEAILQAKKFTTTWQSEVVRYIVHGVLHLLGLDDSKPAARRRMKRVENRLLRKLSLRFALSKL